MICWSCEREGGGGPFCTACKALLPPDDGADRFTVLGLPRQYAVDLASAEAAYQRLSRQLHPDRFATADPRARRASLGHTVQLNEAWRTVKDPVRRAEYLLSLLGVDTTSEAKKPGAGPESGTRRIGAPPAFLLEILELHDDLKSAQRAGDAVKMAFMTEEIRGRAAEAIKTVGTALDAASSRPSDTDLLDEAERALISLRYYQRFLDEATAYEERAAEGPRRG